MKSTSHSFDISLATQLGNPNLAILLNHIMFWIDKNQHANRNFHENKYWMYQTQKEMALNFPYWSLDQIKRFLILLQEKGVLLKGNFNKNTFDKTQWYALSDDFFNEMIDETKSSTPSKNGNSTNRTIDQAKSPTPSKNGNSANRTIDQAKSPNRKSDIADCINTDTETYTKESIPKGIPKKPDANASSRPVPSAQDSPPTLKKSLKKIKRKEHVKTTNEEHERLVKAFGIEKTEMAYDILSDWKKDTPKNKWKKDDNRSVRRWVIDAILENKSKEKRRKNLGDEENNEEYALKAVKNLMMVRGPAKGVILKVVPKGVFFRYKSPTAKKTKIIEFSEKGFIDQLNNEAKKWGLI